MILKECYYVAYHTVDYSDENKIKTHKDAYLDYTNALLVAQEIAKCCDIVDDVSVIDGSTGEILDEFDGDTEGYRHDVAALIEEEPACNDDTFKDRFGYTWKRQGGGYWSLDCTGINCRDCDYSQGLGSCQTDLLTLEEVTKRISGVTR